MFSGYVLLGTFRIASNLIFKVRSMNSDEAVLLQERTDYMLNSALLQLKKLSAENKLLREALAWYASPRTWNQWLPDSAGDMARRALGQ